MFTNSQANHANFATAGISLAILLARIVVGRLRHRELDAAFYLLIASIAAISARITLNWYYLHLGTVNDAISDPAYFETHSVADVVNGSKLLVAARAAITLSLWLQICLLLLFYSHIMATIRWVKVMIYVTWAVTIATFVAVTVIGVTECRPIHRYWQISPDPGACVKAYAQLLSQCISNIVIDLMLLVISFPILFARGRAWTQHLRVGILFMLGTFCIAVSVMRLTAVYGNKGAQAARTLWGAVQIIVSTFVANVPTIYGDVKLVLRKRRESVRLSGIRPESWTRSNAEVEDGLHRDFAKDDKELT